MAKIRVNLFGPTSVVLTDGTVVRDLGGIKPRQVLEILALTWHGGPTEIGTLGALGGLYEEAGRWRKIFTTARLNAGVAVFFVISGFLLYRPFVAARLEGRERPSAGRFWWRRPDVGGAGGLPRRLVAGPRARLWLAPSSANLACCCSTNPSPPSTR